MEESALPSAPVFKKRAKQAVKRRHDSTSSGDETAEPQQHLSVAEILRQRRQGKIRRSALDTSARDSDDHGQFVVPAAGAREESDIDKMKNRFVAQTGEVVGLYDKQM